MINSFFKIQFVKDSLTLITGTSLSQILPLIVYPILTRLYSPEDFGIFTLFMSIIPFLVIFGSGSYEQAIILTTNPVETISLLKLIVKRSTIWITSIVIVSIFLSLFGLSRFNEAFTVQFIIALGLVAILHVFYNCFNEWCVLKKQFKSLSISKIYNSSFILLFKILGNFFSSSGLIFGELVGKFLTVLIALKVFFKNKSALQLKKQDFNTTELKKVYRKFPRIMSFDLLINNLNGSLHVFFISIYFSSKELGFLSLSLSMLTLPVTVISGGIKDVFRQKASLVFQKTGSCRELYKKLFFPILIFGLLGFILLYLIIPKVFPVVFGSEWIVSGYYAQLLVPFACLNFISMSLGGVFVIANKLHISLYWQIFGLITSTIALYYGCVVIQNFESTIKLLVVSKSMTYILYALLSYKYSKQ